MTNPFDTSGVTIRFHNKVAPQREAPEKATKKKTKKKSTSTAK